MGTYLDMVNQRAVEKRNELEQDPSATEDHFECMRIAEKFLAHRKGFAVSQPDMSLVVLKFLGYSDKEINDLYFKLVYEQSTQELYRYVDPNHPVASLSEENRQESCMAEENPEEESEEEPEEEPKEEPKKEPEEEMQEAEKPVREEVRTPKMGRLVYRENGRQCLTDLLPLDPEHETYYYNKYCLGKRDEHGRLHTLIGNEWRYGGPFISYYYDAQYDYWEADYILEPDGTAP